MKKVVVLGSTGSLGTQILKLLRKHSRYFEVIGLSSYKNSKLLKEQAEAFGVPKENVVISSRHGLKNLLRLSMLPEADIIVNVVSGIAGVEPTKNALYSGKTVLLGNKESLVADGEAIMKMVKNDNLIPLDSEHNAIYEILQRNPERKVSKISLPCSGGPFLHKTTKELKHVTAKEALKHPKWKMGDKISIESATLINKGLEIIEAHYLFGLPFSKIKVVIHPECQVHGIVEFEDGETFYYFGAPTMTEHLENALFRTIDQVFTRTIRRKISQKYQFYTCPHKTLPGIKIVTNSFRQSPKTMKAFLKKEEFVIEKFLEEKIEFLDIFKLLA